MLEAIVDVTYITVSTAFSPSFFEKRGGKEKGMPILSIPISWVCLSLDTLMFRSQTKGQR